jgi:polysaccharide biosynthesis/export protein
VVSRVLQGLTFGSAFLLAVLLPAGLCPAQEASSHLIERYLRENPQPPTHGSISRSLLDSLRQSGAISRSLLDSLRGGAIATVDSSGVDTTEPESLATAAARLPPSMYEKLFRGERVDPDSLILHLQVFGQEVFRRNDGSRSAPGQVAVPASYPIGPGDEVVLLLWGRLNEEQHLTVDRNGSINVPRLGPIVVGGLPFSVVQGNLVQRLESIEGVRASVQLGQLRSLQVYVIGEVVSPGLYTVSALSNVTNALFAAGGPTPMGSLRKIELRRGGRLVRRFDFYDFLLKGIDDASVRLLPGDVILVPIVTRMVAVAGNVRRSAIYEMTERTALRELLELAGGVSPAGWVRRIQVERLAQNTYQTVLDVSADAADSIPAFSMEDGDLVRVFPVVNLNEHMVFLEGNVKRPGKYALADGMRLSDILSGYDILLPETYFIYAVLERFDPPSYLARIMPFNLQRVLESKGSPDDLALQSRDRIIIYHRDYFEPDRSVSIDGAITEPGRYKLLDNMRVRDLILQAGGLREEASLYRGELYRRRMDVDSVTTEKVEFSVIGAMSDDAGQNMPLLRFDRVFVRQKRGWEDEKCVALVGEVVYPGTYVLFKGESLEQLVGRAGGFTTDAYLTAAVLTRPSVKALERKRTEDYVQQLERDIVQTTAALAAAEGSQDLRSLLNEQVRVLEKLRTVPAIGRVVIDLNSPASYRGFLLEHGDSLYVPRTLQTVSVIGEVYNPSTFRYDAAAKQARDYLSLSGGTKPTAQRRNTYVIKANGSVVSNRMTHVMCYHLMPGDAVVVPQRISVSSGYRRFSQTLDTVLKLTTISSQVSSSILAMKLATQ